MKKISTLFFAAILSLNLMASDLVIIKTENFNDVRILFESENLKIHFFRDDFVIATAEKSYIPNSIIIDENAWSVDASYYIAYVNTEEHKNAYKDEVNNRAEILFDGDYFLVIKTDEIKYGQLPPSKNDGMVGLFDIAAKLPEIHPFFKSYSISDPDAFILELMDEVDGSLITANVQHMQYYVTRNAYSPQSVEAQIWLQQEFEFLGLDVEVMDFSMPNGPASDNVIATLVGTTYPEEYVVLGAHYDSISRNGDAPGADDNASGTAAVLEIARILSQYDFERSIIFCAFSGEEYGLFGSKAYANRCAQQGMNILGYFNLDMIGYLKPGNTTVKSSLIYPGSAAPLADFYTNITSVYLPDFVVTPASFSGGDSDHTAFNINGYMGIFPFEDINNYSPYIHTYNDIVGLSYNNENQAVIFTQAVLASVVTMAVIGESVIGINEPMYHSRIFPNPSNGNLSIVLNDDKNVRIIISDMSGRVVYNSIAAGNIVIDVSGLKSGLYILSIENDTLKESHKIVVL
ncbi:MAG: M20/M25/M40 family metallo-hydrolase [Bacteroidetes bacterium]|nr:M20/M25/M40 family metallo-hydrolase [Bacteroidota bacterium]